MQRIPCFLLALAACAAPQHGTKVLELSTGCLGYCQAFAITVYGDGWVDYTGYTNVPLDYRGKPITPRQLAALDQVVRASPFPAVDPVAQRACPTDSGTLVTIWYRGQYASVFDLCDTEIAVILFHRIKLVLGLDRWLDD